MGYLHINAPLISSFLISWIVCNWKIILLLFWYSTEEIYNDYSGYRISAISLEMNWLNSVVLPLSFALLYVFIYPFVREFFRSYNAYVKVKGNRSLNKRTKGLTIPYEKYETLTDLYLKKSNAIDSLRQEEETFKIKESEYIANLNKSEGEKLELQKEIGKYESLIKYYVDKADLSILEKKEWYFFSPKTYTSGSHFCTAYFEYENKTVRFHAYDAIKSIFFNIAFYKIINFVHNPVNKTISINLKNTMLNDNNPTSLNITILKYEENTFNASLIVHTLEKNIQVIDIQSINYSENGSPNTIKVSND